MHTNLLLLKSEQTWEQGGIEESIKPAVEEEVEVLLAWFQKIRPMNVFINEFILHKKVSNMRLNET